MAALERAEEKRWAEDMLLPGCPYQAIDVNVANAQGNTPLHLAAELGALPVVAFLLSVGADASLENAGNLTALEVARLAKREQVFAALRAKKKLGPDSRDRGVPGCPGCRIGVTQVSAGRSLLRCARLSSATAPSCFRCCTSAVAVTSPATLRYRLGHLCHDYGTEPMSWSRDTHMQTWT